MNIFDSPDSNARRYGRAVVLACLLGVVLLAAASGAAAADQHDPDSAPTYDTAEGETNVTVTFPDQSDHYPGQDEGSMQYFAGGSEAFEEQDAEEGLWLDTVVVRAYWIDFRECFGSRNTGVLGIDRGNDDSGTTTDETLTDHRLRTRYGQEAVAVEFYEWDSDGMVGGDPPYLAGEDAVVLAIGNGSNDGPCLTMTDRPGWYQVEAFLNGSVATSCTEEGNQDCEPDDEKVRGVTMLSTYVYVCACDDREQARETLGSPPNETPTPTASPTPVGSPTSAGGSTATDTQDPDGDDSDDDTDGDGPGMGPSAAVVALVAAVLLARRRR
ncbi:hypothetical protein BRC75_07750 [Halobacteriales archaeon QH_7_69_31]|nr:MAG: hypothetical protein BRC75_07750 [Halobacteriales archaeon QH_7_69_31]